MDIFEFTITAYYLWTILNICSTLFVLHIEINTMQPINTIITLMWMCWTFAQMFIFCELGENVTDQFNQISNAIYSSDWYMFPKEIQRIIPIIAMSAQRPVIIQGFVNLKCTREASSRVNHQIEQFSQCFFDSF